MPTRAKISADEPLHDLDWLAEYLDKPKKTIYNWNVQGVGPPHYLIGTTLRYRKSEVDHWISQHRAS
jgi:predicted DNA-binding transcriptional regulator AlpA